VVDRPPDPPCLICGERDKRLVQVWPTNPGPDSLSVGVICAKHTLVEVIGHVENDMLRFIVSIEDMSQGG
jgi:hypothetical protein